MKCFLTEQRYSAFLNDPLWSVTMAYSVYQYAWEFPQAEVHFKHIMEALYPLVLKIVSCCYSDRSAFHITTELLN
jgi:hypothetical protein